MARRAEKAEIPKGTRVVVTCEEIEYPGTVDGYLPGFGIRTAPSLWIISDRDHGQLRRFDRSRCSVRLASEPVPSTRKKGA